MALVDDRTRDTALLATYERTIKDALVKKVEDEIMKLIKPRIKEIVVDSVMDWNAKFMASQGGGSQDPLNQTKLASIIFTEKVFQKMEDNYTVQVIDKK